MLSCLTTSKRLYYFDLLLFFRELWLWHSPNSGHHKFSPFIVFFDIGIHPNSSNDQRSYVKAFTLKYFIFSWVIHKRVILLHTLLNMHKYIYLYIFCSALIFFVNLYSTALARNTDFLLSEILSFQGSNIYEHFCTY